MPFGLKIAAATFQKAMDVILASVKWLFAIENIHDIIIFVKLLRHYYSHREAVLRLLINAGLTLKLKKSHFFRESIDYHKHVMAPGKLQVVCKTTEANSAPRHPAAVFEMGLYLGLCNVYRRFAAGLAKTAAPLNMRLKQEEPLQFGLKTTRRKAVDDLKKRLISKPVLALAKSTAQLMVDPDS